MRREQIYDFAKDFEDNTYGPKVGKVDLKTGTVSEIDLTEGTLKLHSQVIQVQSKNPKFKEN